ncbi:MAG: hypothetical protein U0694_28070 [Anaerolineae bacterium]
MAYRLTWYVPAKVLQLQLEGDISASEFAEANAMIAREIEQTEGKVALVVDASAVTEISSVVSKIKRSQTYSGHPRLGWIFVIGTDKFIRLMMTVIFNVVSAKMQLFPDHNQMRQFLKPLLGEMGSITYSPN